MRAKIFATGGLVTIFACVTCAVFNVDVRWMPVVLLPLVIGGIGIIWADD